MMVNQILMSVLRQLITVIKNVLTLMGHIYVIAEVAIDLIQMSTAALVTVSC